MHTAVRSVASQAPPNAALRGACLRLRGASGLGKEQRCQEPLLTLNSILTTEP